MATARRPLWEGHLRLSLVTCPVALYSATTRAHDVSFHLIHPKTNNRIRMVPHDPELGEVRRDELVKGYEVAKEVDTVGRAVCLTTTLEHAELKRDQIHAYGKDTLIARCQGSMSASIEAES